jgi:hypothetical protein
MVGNFGWNVKGFQISAFPWLDRQPPKHGLNKPDRNSSNVTFLFLLPLLPLPATLPPPPFLSMFSPLVLSLLVSLNVLLFHHNADTPYSQRYQAKSYVLSASMTHRTSTVSHHLLAHHSQCRCRLCLGFVVGHHNSRVCIKTPSNYPCPSLDLHSTSRIAREADKFHISKPDTRLVFVCPIHIPDPRRR